MHTKAQENLSLALKHWGIYKDGVLTTREMKGRIESTLSADTVHYVLDGLPLDAQLFICANIEKWPDLDREPYSFEPKLQPGVLPQLRDWASRFRKTHEGSEREA